MIPTIETIIENVMSGAITKQQAIAWLHQHAENAGRDLRDDFAATALQGLIINSYSAKVSRLDVTREAYLYADDMLTTRQS